MSWIKHNIQKTNDIFTDYRCINCGKSLDQLYVELVDAIDMRVWNQWVFEGIKNPSVNIQIGLVEEHHQGCLTEEEFMIKDLIE